MSIEAMRLALETLKCLLAGNSTSHQAANAITALRQAIEQAQQAEPVAWGVDWSKDGTCVSIIKRLPDGVIEVVAVEYGPPPRQWVGLTDEEQQELYDAWIKIGDGWGSFYALIEAKLKEKNT